MAKKMPPLSSRGLGSFLLILMVCSVLPVALIISLGVGIPFIFAVFVGYLAQLIVWGAMALRWKIYPKDPWIVIAAIYAILQSLTLGTVVLAQGTYEIMDLAGVFAKIVGILLFAGMMQALHPSEREIEKFLKGFLVLTFLALIFALIIDSDDLLNISNVSSSYELVVSSFFANRNQFGSFLFVSLVAHALYLNGRKLKLWNIMFFCFQVVFLTLTMSRGSFLAMVLFAGSFALFNLKRRPKYFVLFMGTIVTFAVVLLNTQVGATLQQLLFRTESGVSGRDVIWNYGTAIWLDYGVLFGTGTFRGVQLAQELGMGVSEFHSWIIDTLVSGGVFELFLLLIILGKVWFDLAKSGLDNYRRFVLYSAGIGILGLSFVESISIFTMGFVGTMYSIFLVSLPILYANLSLKRAQLDEKRESLRIPSFSSRQ